MSDSSEAGRTAVILYGVVHRSLGHVVDSLREMVLEPLGAAGGGVEVFFHSWDLERVDNPRTGETGVMVGRDEVLRLLPEARGVFDSQEAFDSGIDWEPLFERNPMRHCTDGEEAARVTLMNYFRALESMERAWRFFEETKSGGYERVVATRPDLRFLEKLEIDLGGQECPPSLWIPDFHGWGGVNDRFVLGGEREVGIWCRRGPFARECVLAGKGWNPERVLEKWLHVSGVQVGFFDFVFQRVRANGEVAGMDRELRPWGGTPDTGSPASLLRQGYGQPKTQRRVAGRRVVKERFLILAREEGVATENLRRVLEPLGKVEVVVDRVRDGEADRSVCPPIWIPDEEAEGFGGMMSHSGAFPWVTAWSRALCHAARTFGEDEAVWFVEDDVAGDAEAFKMLVEGTAAHGVDLAASDVRTREEEGHWPYWNYADGFFHRPARGFHPLCRLSGRLVRAVLECRELNGRCTFHEVMFPSVAREQGMSWMSWSRDAKLRRCFGEFRYRPEVIEVMNGVSHPVKDGRVHEAITGLTEQEFPRMREAALEGWSILADDYRFLVRYCRELGIRRVVEFGPGDSTAAFLDAGCEVASFDHDETWLQKARERFAGEAGVSLAHCPEGTLPDAEALPFEPELVMVDGPPFREGQAMSRIGPCEWALEQAGHFILHDAERLGEQETLAEMECRGMRVTRIPTRKGLAVVVDPGWSKGKGGGC